MGGDHGEQGDICGCGGGGWCGCTAAGHPTAHQLLRPPVLRGETTTLSQSLIANCGFGGEMGRLHLTGNVNPAEFILVSQFMIATSQIQ